jgi:hypothetical protein
MNWSGWFMVFIEKASSRPVRGFLHLQAGLPMGEKNA